MKILIFAGPNGAGKSTVATHLLPDNIVFLNADDIARDEGMDEFQAGRLFLERLSRLVLRGASVAIETTLASRSLASRLVRMRARGYRVRLFYLWVRSPELSVARVVERVRRGGHQIPEATIRRRFHASLRHLFDLYLPLCDEWQVEDNSGDGSLILVASGEGLSRVTVYNMDIWNTMREVSRHA